jgi:N-acetylglucosamine repressor
VHDKVNRIGKQCMVKQIRACIDNIMKKDIINESFPSAYFNDKAKGQPVTKKNRVLIADGKTCCRRCILNPAALISKQKNMIGILNHIIINEKVSRPALAAEFKVSTATITNIINELMAVGLVYEGGIENSDIGRKAKLIRFNARYRYVLIGAIVNEQKLHLYVCDLLGNIIDFTQEHIPMVLSEENDEEQITSRILEATTAFQSRQPQEIKDKLAAAAFSIPGLVNYSANIYAPLLNWRSFALKNVLAGITGLPVYLENVTRVQAVYEMRFIDEIEKNVIYLSLSPGTGMVNFFDGKMIMGSNGISGEVGHMSLDIDGEPCYCGNRGCFELFCGELSLIHKGEEILREGCPVLQELVEKQGRLLNIGTLIDAKNKNSAKVSRLLKKAGKHLGCGLTSLINCFDPDRIILSGTLIEQDKDVLQYALEEMKMHIVNKFSRNPVISLGKLHEDEMHKALCAFVLEKLLPEFIQ